jgi:hypothetical protein
MDDVLLWLFGLPGKRRRQSLRFLANMFTRTRRIRESLRPPSSRLPELSRPKGRPSAGLICDRNIRLSPAGAKGLQFPQKDVYAINSRILCRSGYGRYSGDRAYRRVRA